MIRGVRCGDEGEDDVQLNLEQLSAAGSIENRLTLTPNDSFLGSAW